MSTSNPPSTPAAAAPAPAQAAPRKREVIIVSHCSLFYWWPVWAVGFLLFAVTSLWGEFMVTVPPGTEAKREGATVKVQGNPDEPRDALVLPAKKHLHPEPAAREAAKLPDQPHMWMSSNKNLGVFFVAILLLVITITNIPLRGLWMQMFF